jgi:hypothetical protein
MFLGASFILAIICHSALRGCVFRIWMVSQVVRRFSGIIGDFGFDCRAWLSPLEAAFRKRVIYDSQIFQWL